MRVNSSNLTIVWKTLHFPRFWMCTLEKVHFARRCWLGKSERLPPWTWCLWGKWWRWQPGIRQRSHSAWLTSVFFPKNKVPMMEEMMWAFSIFAKKTKSTCWLLARSWGKVRTHCTSSSRSQRGWLSSVLLGYVCISVHSVLRIFFCDYPTREWKMEAVSHRLPFFWVNPDLGGTPHSLTIGDIEDAESRLLRFAPVLSKLFPELQARGGVRRFCSLLIKKAS